MLLNLRSWTNESISWHRQFPNVHNLSKLPVAIIKVKIKQIIELLSLLTTILVFLVSHITKFVFTPREALTGHEIPIIFSTKE